MKIIDLRSDTVTKPTREMREAIAAAEVGDDVYGEDPSVNRLEEAVADRLGMERALFFPSGTMANQVALRVHTHHGDVVLASAGAHILRYESGAAAALAGLQIQTLGSDGSFSADDVRGAIAPPDHHCAPTTLVAIENTHNAAGGRIVPLHEMKELSATAHGLGLRVHLDGARLFNAEVATGMPARRWAELADTVSVCLSKGLGAPVGSVLCGAAPLIDRAHRLRKMLGGGMRQAGVLAAAGLYALEHHVARLADDHRNARRLAAGLQDLGLAVTPPPETNIVRVAVDDAPAFQASCAQRKLLINPISATALRAVTHLGVASVDIDEALHRIGEVLAERRR